MKRKFIFIPLILAIAFSTLNACKKDKEVDRNEEMEINSANIIGTYKVTAETDKLGHFPETNSFPSDYPDCEIDNLISIESGEICKFIDAGITCTESTGSTVKWSLIGKIIYLGESNYAIEKLTRSQLVISYSRASWFEGTSYTRVTTTTYTRQ